MLKNSGTFQHAVWGCRFFQRPNKTISKSEYIEEAKNIGERAKALSRAATELKKTQETSGRNRKLRQQAKALGKELSVLEDDEKTLESLYPQVCTFCMPLLHDSHCATCMNDYLSGKK